MRPAEPDFDAAAIDAMTEIFNFDDSRDCFGCGSDNPIGLRMRFYTDGDRVVSRVRAGRHLCGWSSILHGGIVATVLDETMSWTAHHLLRKLILTKSMTTQFHRTVPVEREIRCVGRVREATSPREAVLEAALVDDAGVVCATGTGTFALLSAAVARRLGVIDERVIARFEAFAAEKN